MPTDQQPPDPTARTVRIFKAQPVREDRPVPPVFIHIADTQPTGGDNRWLHQADARLLADALTSSLPGATLDLLVAELLERHASRLRVSYDRPPGPEPTGGTVSQPRRRCSCGRVEAGAATHTAECDNGPVRARYCPDEARCHHECADEECFRVRECLPLEGAYQGGMWPAAVLARYAPGENDNEDNDESGEQE